MQASCQGKRRAKSTQEYVPGPPLTVDLNRRSGYGLGARGLKPLACIVQQRFTRELWRSASIIPHPHFDACVSASWLRVVLLLQCEYYHQYPSSKATKLRVSRSIKWSLVLQEKVGAIAAFLWRCLVRLLRSARVLARAQQVLFYQLDALERELSLCKSWLPTSRSF
jgi:hypothetical protein